MLRSINGNRKPPSLRFCSLFCHNLPFAPWSPPPGCPACTQKVCEHRLFWCFWEDALLCQSHRELDPLHYPLPVLDKVIKQFSVSFLAFQFRRTNFTRSKDKKFLLLRYLTWLLYTSNAAYLIYCSMFSWFLLNSKYTVTSYKLTDVCYLKGTFR